MALPTGTCGDIIPAGTPGLGDGDTAFPVTSDSGLGGRRTREVGGTGHPLGKTSFPHCQG